MTGAEPIDSLVRSLAVLAPHLQSVTRRRDPPSDLPIGAARALLVVATAEDGVGVGEVARRLELAPPRASRLLGVLETRGLVRRARDAQDRRRVIVRVSAAGRREFVAWRSAHRDRLRTLLDVLGPRDAQQFVRLLERAASRLTVRSPRHLRTQGAVQPSA
jgi:DNA-binding MarR family transcriptional regulator